METEFSRLKITVLFLVPTLALLRVINLVFLIHYIHTIYAMAFQTNIVIGKPFNDSESHCVNCIRISIDKGHIIFIVYAWKCNSDLNVGL